MTPPGSHIGRPVSFRKIDFYKDMILPGPTLDSHKQLLISDLK